MQTATVTKDAGQVSSYFNTHMKLGSAMQAYQRYGHGEPGAERSLVTDLINMTKSQSQCLHVNDACFM